MFAGISFGLICVLQLPGEWELGQWGSLAVLAVVCGLMGITCAIIEQTNAASEVAADLRDAIGDLLDQHAAADARRMENAMRDAVGGYLADAVRDVVVDRCPR